MPNERPRIEQIVVRAPVDLRLDGREIARILLEWGAPPLAAGGAANAILAYIARAIRDRGGETVQ